MPGSTSTPTPRFGLRWKITLPFILLALILSLGMVYLLGLTVNQEQQARILRQLTDGGQQAADAVVRVESELLAVERLIANTEGVLDGVQRADAESLRAGILPLVVNAGADVVSILDGQGTSLLSIRRDPGASAGEYGTLRGEGFYTAWPFVQRLLTGSVDPAIGDKQSGVHALRIGESDTPVFFVGGPVRDSGGTIHGAVLVGRYLASLMPEIAGQAGASVSIYDQFDGRLLASSLEPDNPAAMTVLSESIEQAMAPRESGDPIRNLPVSGTEYTEVLTAFVARQGTEPLGVLGVALPRVSLAGGTSDDLLRVIVFGAVALILVVGTGLLISNSITRPIIAIADASAQVALGNLDTRVVHQGTDELGVLARTFNQMVDDLRQRTMTDARLPSPATEAARPAEPAASTVTA
ncbi:MAG: HAMP domain-containing protein, partial [Chloroflexi bacterium]|nr:HAMP domain-containing protein [Chloroflexota bacterium]